MRNSNPIMYALSVAIMLTTACLGCLSWGQTSLSYQIPGSEYTFMGNCSTSTVSGSDSEEKPVAGNVLSCKDGMALYQVGNQLTANLNWGKFLIGQHGEYEWGYNSVIGARFLDPSTGASLNAQIIFLEAEGIKPTAKKELLLTAPTPESDTQKTKSVLAQLVDWVHAQVSTTTEPQEHSASATTADLSLNARIEKRLSLWEAITSTSSMLEMHREAEGNLSVVKGLILINSEMRSPVISDLGAVSFLPQNDMEAAIRSVVEEIDSFAGQQTCVGNFIPLPQIPGTRPEGISGIFNARIDSKGCSITIALNQESNTGSR